MRIRWAERVTFLLVSLGLAAPGGAQASLDRLRAAVAAVAEEVDGDLGVAIEHLETGQAIEVNGDEPFPLASTFKVAVLVELFNQVDAGKVKLDDMVTLEPDDLHLGSGQLRNYLLPGVSLSVENLAFLMMRISDNSATDRVMRLVGVENINARLDELGVRGVSVDRTCQRLILDWLGMAPEQTAGMSSKEVLDFLNAYEPADGELEEAENHFLEDHRDMATPLGMNHLLESIFTGQAASRESCDRMVDIMLKCDTGQNRLRGFLPEAVQVAHKTGTLGGTVNNVGILYLPEGRGHVAVSVLSKNMEDREAAERAIAQVARYAYDYFLFTAPAEVSEAPRASDFAKASSGPRRSPQGVGRRRERGVNAR